MKKKVFCIGFHKTGTTSIAEALEILGYRVTGPNGVNDPNIASNVMCLARQLIPEYDAFQDNPWPLLYKEIDREYPDSKFILTIRPPKSWIHSQVKHFGKNETPMRRWIYGENAGCPEGNEALYLDRYNEHNEKVIKYFEGRERDFLLMDLSKSDGWDKLCPFLDEQTPASEFPHSNKANSRKIYNRLLRKIARILVKNRAH